MSITQGGNIPNKIADKENIVRCVFSKIHIDPTNKKLSVKPNWLKPPPDKDEISVNRFDYTDEHFMKAKGLKMENPTNKKNFFGLGFFKAETVKNNGFSIVPTKLPKDPTHSDIKIGVKSIQGEPLPPEVNFKLKNIIKSMRLFIDKDVSNPQWGGDKINL